MSPYLRGSSVSVLSRVSVLVKLLRPDYLPYNLLHLSFPPYLQKHCCKKLHHTYKRSVLGKLLSERLYVSRDMQLGISQFYSTAGNKHDITNPNANGDCKTHSTSGNINQNEEPKSILSSQPKYFSLEDTDSIPAEEHNEQTTSESESNLKKLFRFPKNNLDNVYHTISHKLGSSHNVQINHIKVSEIPISWECTAKTLWPAEKTFMSMGSSKSESTNGVSLKVLQWLQDIHILNKNGQIDLKIVESMKDPKSLLEKSANTVTSQNNQGLGLQKESQKDHEGPARGQDLIFPHPKNKLDNVLNMISLKSRRLQKLKVDYEEVGSNPNSWKCSVVIPFPHEAKFTETAASKTEAIKKASVNILAWLQEQGTLTKEGEVSPSLLQELERNATTRVEETINKASQKQTEFHGVETEMFDDKEFDLIKKTFPFPRNNVGNVYGSFSSKLGQKHKAVYEYKELSKNPPLWKSLAKVTWPIEKQFESSSNTKSEAGHRVSLYILKWLQDQGLINKHGDVLLKNNNKEEKKVSRTSLNQETGMELKKMDEEFTLKKKSLQAIFPFPKSNLNNAYAMISSQLGTQHKVKYEYKQVSVLPPCWQCTASVTWPAPHDDTCLASTKSEAALRASLNVLNWLQVQRKINQKGEVALMIHTNRQTVRVPPVAEIKLSANSLASIEHIVNQYYKDVLTIQETPVTEEIPATEEGTPTKVDMSTVEPTIESDDEEYFNFNEIESLPIQRHKRLLPHVADRRDQELYRRYLREKPRRDKISAALPIDKYREEIVQLVDENRVVVIKGEPGCGKSTQVAQYLLEWHAARQAATDCNIVITQPRRISAISLADRVASERNERVGDVVGYQVRLDSKRPRYSDGFILFCSTGLLVRRIISDAELAGVSHVIVDEAHERDTQVDFLLLLLKRALEINTSLKVIVMSATINAELFTEFFNKCPSISIPGFTFPVEQHFLNNDFKNMLMNQGVKFPSEDAERPTINTDAIVGMVTWIHKNKPKGAILVFLPGWLEIRTVMDQLLLQPHAGEFRVVPAHSKLSSEDQRLIFSVPQDGIRKIILSTNIAETSLTINDVVYVVDSGALKEERMDIKTGLVSLDNQWASQANVQQRKGRAGRVQPGESFHLFSEEKYNSLNPFPIPEINRIPLTRSVLDVKMYTKDEDISQFMSCLPEPPRQEAVTQAIRVLQSMGALDDDENLSALGKRIYRFPLDPYLSKILVHGCLFQCANPLLSMVTLLSADFTIFENTLGMRSQIRQLKQEYSPSSDHVATSVMYREWENHGWTDPLDAQVFCQSKGLSSKNMERTKQLRGLHTEHLRAAKLIDGSENINDELSSCNKFSAYPELLKGLLLSGLGKFLTSTTSRKNPRGSSFRTMDGSLAIISTESVNSKFRDLPTPFLTYFKSMSSTERRAVIVHESTLLSPVTVALFLPGVMTLKNMAGLTPGKAVINIEGQRPVNILIDQKEGEQLLHLRQVIWNVLEYLVENEGEPKDSEQYNAIAAFREDLLTTLANVTSEQGALLDYTESGELRTEPPAFVRPQWG